MYIGFSSLLLVGVLSLNVEAFSPIREFSGIKPVTQTFVYEGDNLGYFDPLKLGVNKSEKKVKLLREAELQHSRVAMISILAMMGIDMFQDKPAINYLFDMNWDQQYLFWNSAGITEFGRLLIGWKYPNFGEKNPKYFELKEEYQPGNLLGREVENIEKNLFIQELNNGRLAMLACIIYMGTELATGRAIF